MARAIVVRVPLPPDAALALLLRAAETLQHQVVHADVAQGRAELRADFSLRAMSTFHVHAEAAPLEGGATRLSLRVRSGFKLLAWTGVGQSERIGWRLIGKMQELYDPERYQALEDAPESDAEHA
jgi:hypothetical protein